MFNFADSSFHRFFDTQYDIRRFAATLTLRAIIQAAGSGGVAGRYRLTAGTITGLAARLELLAQQESLAACLYGISAVSRLALELGIISAGISGTAWRLVAGGSPECRLSAVFRVRGEERFTN